MSKDELRFHRILPAGELAAGEERQAVSAEAAERCYLGLPSVQARCLGRPASEVD